MLKLKIGQRALLLFVAVSMTPVLFLNTYWLYSQQGVLRTEAERRQALVTASAAGRTNEFISQKVNALILHAQTTTVLDGKIVQAQNELQNYIKQDTDIDSVVLTDKSGKQVVSIVADGGNEQEKKAIAAFDTTTPFKVVTFLGGKEYISPVVYIEDRPHLQIAVPVLVFSQAQNFNQLSTSERGVIRAQDDINGALIVLVDLSTVWEHVFADETNLTAFSYIVDDKKRIVGHPDANLSKTMSDISNIPSVQYFFDNPSAASDHTIETTGLSGTKVLTTFAKVPLTNWMVITEEPVGVIASTAQTVASRVWLLNILFACIAVALSYVFSRRITKPIKLLARDANAIGAGNFDTRVNTSSEDEIGQLGHALNDMGGKLKTMVDRIDAERNQLDIVLNSITEGIFALDKSGNIKLTNTAALKLFGVTTEQVMNTPFSKLAAFKQDLAHITIDVSEIKFDDNNVVEFKDMQFMDSMGKTRFVDVLVARIAHAQNDIEMIVTVLDQTSGRELETMKVDFVSLAAHELRTPLTAIRGYLELSLKDQNPSLSDKHRRFLLQANDSSQQLTSLINNLLNVSKIERNALKMSMDKIDWTVMVQNSVMNQQFSAEKAKLTLNYDGPETGVSVIGDSVALREVIDNLIANAIHYTSEKGSVVVQLSIEGGQVITRVKDTGIGIPQDAVNKLFTKFYRVHGGLATGSGGSGLGLYISKSIVELHNGTISVESKEGVGSTFTITLPEFDDARFQKYQSSPEQQTVRRKHGWITKNTSR